MKNLILILIFFAAFSCAKKKDDALIIPPSFNEIPDPKNPEKNSQPSNDEDLQRLKELLLDS
jgi:hypothetical protein